MSTLEQMQQHPQRHRRRSSGEPITILPSHEPLTTRVDGDGDFSDDERGLRRHAASARASLSDDAIDTSSEDEDDEVRGGSAADFYKRRRYARNRRRGYLTKREVRELEESQVDNINLKVQKLPLVLIRPSLCVAVEWRWS